MVSFLGIPHLRSNTGFFKEQHPCGFFLRSNAAGRIFGGYVGVLWGHLWGAVATYCAPKAVCWRLRRLGALSEETPACGYFFQRCNAAGRIRGYAPAAPLTRSCEFFS